jgi:predicted regulator of Ras-like GTPase activity (Roadblock/LC7/MglB family)
MQWLNDALSEIRDILQRQSILVGPMADELEAARLDRDLEKLLSALVQRIATCEGIEAVLASKGEVLMASAGPLIDYVALSEASHGAHWAMEKVAKAYALGEIQQTVLVGDDKKLAMLTIGSVNIAIVSEKDVTLAQSLSM